MNKKHEIYMDHASTTYMDSRVLEEMLPYFTEKYGNPESHHIKGKEALIAVDNARETISKFLNCRESEIIFTAGGTESNNLAIFGIAKTLPAEKNHLITSKIEHPSVFNPFKELEKQGFKVTYLDVDEFGILDIKQFEQTVNKKTGFVSIMYANNEIGTIQPVQKIGEICRKKEIPFHTDACQAAGVLNIDTDVLNLDAMTINGSKIYGPKGIGALFIRREVSIEPINFGGGQEKNRRSGTHNVPGIVGLAKALELAQQEKEKENQRLINLRDKLIKILTQKIPDCRLNGHPEKRLPNNINLFIKGVFSAELLLHLDEAGIFGSAASACKTSCSTPSHVLEAIGLSHKETHNSIRLTIGKRTTVEDIDYTIDTITNLAKKLR